jgi:hypothetical protein
MTSMRYGRPEAFDLSNVIHSAIIAISLRPGTRPALAARPRDVPY